MKIEHLFEVRTTTDIPNLGTDLQHYTKRQLLKNYNGCNIYVRYRNDDNTEWLIDIDEQAFVCGKMGNQFKGHIKHNIFVTARGWTTPESCNKGLITNIMFYMFNEQNCALMCDDIISPSGKAMWLKLCNMLKITDCYAVNRETKLVEPISKQQMLQQFNSGEDDWQYIIEDNFDYSQMVSNILPGYLLKESLIYKKYDFEGWL